MLYHVLFIDFQTHIWYNPLCILKKWINSDIGDGCVKQHKRKILKNK